MTAYIATTATGDISTGSLDYKSVFAVGTVLFVMTLVDERDQHQARPQVPRGLRVSDGPGASAPRNRLAVAGARATTAGDAARPAARRRDPQRGLRRRCCCSPSLIALAGLLALLIQAFVKGAPALSTDLFTNPPSTALPGESRLPAGDHRLAAS